MRNFFSNLLNSTLDTPNQASKAKLMAIVVASATRKVVDFTGKIGSSIKDARNEGGKIRWVASLDWM